MQIALFKISYLGHQVIHAWPIPSLLCEPVLFIWLGRRRYTSFQTFASLSWSHFYCVFRSCSVRWNRCVSRFRSWSALIFGL